MTRSFLFAIALCLPLLAAGCGSLGGLPGLGSSDAPEEAENTMASAENEATDTEALLARMERLEQDLAEVQIELSRVLPADEEDEEMEASTQSSDPASDPEQTSDQENNLERNTTPANLRSTTAEAPTPPADVQTASAPAGDFAVHLASYRDRQGAIEGWEELRRRFSPVLTGLEPRVSEVAIEDRGTFYRLKAGPFVDWAGANEVCDYLRGSSWSCAVMDFGGQTIN